MALALGCVDAKGEAPAKRVEVDKSVQVLRCYEDDSLVFTTRVSTGRRGYETPSGQFEAGVKLRMHYSSRYNDAPMPYSVQFDGNYFIHGYTDVPARPASHGCIRVPLTAARGGGNPAAWFYGWVEVGTPIYVYGQWIGRSTPRPKEWQAVAVRSTARAPKAKVSFFERLFGGTTKRP